MPVSNHAVIIEIKLQNEGLGDDGQHELVRQVAGEIERIVREAAVGEYDGDEFGGGSVTLYIYGPDADRISSAVRPALERLVAGRTKITLRYGDADDPKAAEGHFAV